MPDLFADSPEFRRLLDGAERPSLLRIALEIARDTYPEIMIDHYLGEVDRLVERIRSRCGLDAKPRKVLGQINWALFVEEGYEGDKENYFDPRNSYLNEVIDRKRGIPISLSILYWTLADKLGLTLEGVNLPAHFMLCLGRSPQLIFIDPFHSGDLLDLPACERRLSELTRRRVELTQEQVAPCSPRTVVTRMLRNLKAVYLGMHDFVSAYRVQTRLAAAATGDLVEQRDLGMICLQVERPGEAIDPLEAYVNGCPDADDIDAVRELLKAARRGVAQWN